MTRKPTTNIAASVYDRLLNRARDRGEDFQLTLQRYAIERLLVRLEQSPYGGRFILKGAMLYVVWSEEAYRPTRDLDLLSRAPADLDTLASLFRELCALQVEADGLDFLSDKVRVEPIREREEYGGIRVLLEAHLGNAQVSLRVDIGFGDVVVPGPKTVSFPTLLGSPAPRIRAYTRESVVAEKLHAAVRLADANTRMKDFFDIYSLSQLFPFEGPTLTEAIAATFKRRKTVLPSAFPLRPSFFGQPECAKQWTAFLKRIVATAPSDFATLGEEIHGFLATPYSSLMAGDEFRLSWEPGGPWK